MNTLIVIPDADVSDIVRFYLESNFGARTQVIDSFEAALDVLGSEAQGTSGAVDAVIAGGFESLTTALGFCERLAATMNRSPLIVLEASTFVDALKPRLTDRRIESVTLDMLEVGLALALENLVDEKSEAAKANTPEADEFFGLKLKTLLRLQAPSCELFLRITLTGRYVRVSRPTDYFSLEDLQRFSEKGVDTLYIRRSDSKRILEASLATFRKIDSDPSTSIEMATRYSRMAYRTAATFAAGLGTSPEVQELIGVGINLTLKTIQRNPVLRKLFRKLTAHEGLDAASHAYAMAHVSCGIASLLGWVSESTFYKLTTASFVHDLTLADDALAGIESREELDREAACLSPTVVEAYRSHPIKSAALLSGMSQDLSDVDKIVSQHHERPDGTGFPYGLNHRQIAPLSAVFIVAHVLVHAHAISPKTFDLARLVRELGPSYGKGGFRPILNAIERALEKAEISDSA